jgi:hypothetical protein
MRVRIRHNQYETYLLRISKGVPIMHMAQQIIGPHIWVKQAPAWNAVVDTLALPLFSDEQRARLTPFVDLSHRQVDWGGIHGVAKEFPREQQTLLRIAHALFNGGDCQLAELGDLSSGGRSAAILLIGQRYR